MIKTILKHSIVIICVSLVASSVFSLSYKDNTYQRLANEYKNKASRALDMGQYDKADEYARKAAENAELSMQFVAKMASQEIVEKKGVLPRYYVVQPWSTSSDCLWNIAERVYVYSDPFLWKKLYQANKDKLPNANNPDLITPGLKIEIPSLEGEERDGVYGE